MKTIYLVRHCKAYGQASSAKLTDEGKQQAEKLAEFFADRNIQYILSSPYHRAIATIKPLAEKHRLTIHLDERLRERILSTIDVPDWIEKLKVSFTDMDLRFAGGESSREAMDRGVSVINEVMKRPEKRLAVITHGNLMTLILKYFDEQFGFEDWEGLTYPDVYELTVSNGGKKRLTRIWEQER